MISKASQYCMKEMMTLGFGEPDIRKELELDIKSFHTEITRLMLNRCELAHMIQKRQELAEPQIVKPNLLGHIFMSEEKAIPKKIREHLYALMMVKNLRARLEQFETKNSWSEEESKLWEIVTRRLDDYEAFLRYETINTN